MNGATLVGKSIPPASPQAATAPPVFRHREHVGERGRADRVDAAGPALLGERPRRPGQFLALDDLGGAEPLEIVGLLRPAGRGGHLESRAWPGSRPRPSRRRRRRR